VPCCELHAISKHGMLPLLRARWKLASSRRQLALSPLA
jgi:hypothetical protein